MYLRLQAIISNFLFLDQFDCFKLKYIQINCMKQCQGFFLNCLPWFETKWYLIQ